MPMPIKDMTGKRFGRLVVIARAGSNNYSRLATWSCKCDCGNESIVVGQSLRSGITKSCGCLKVDLACMRQQKRIKSVRTAFARRRQNREYVNLLEEW
jgi:hypothetical protein